MQHLLISFRRNGLLSDDSGKVPEPFGDFCSRELRPVFRTFCLLTLRGHFPSHIFESLFWRFVADA
jgi:hypothetical protein